MTIKPIKTESEYEAALVSIEAMFDAKPNTPKGDRLDVLTTLVEAYEARHYAMYPPDPVEAIRFHLEQNDLSPSDIAEYLGGRNRVSEILSRKRPLTVAMMRSLHKNLGIPAESLLGI